jgi:hypothetical protein
MRYHWGLGVGHLHAHQSAITACGVLQEDVEDSQALEKEGESAETLGGSKISVQIPDGDSDIYDSDASELGLQERELEGWDDVESVDQEDGCQENMSVED